MSTFDWTTCLNLIAQEQQCDCARPRSLLPSPSWLLLHQLTHGVPFLWGGVKAEKHNERASNDLSYFQLSRYPVGPKTLIFRFWSRLGTLCWWLPRWPTPRTMQTSVPWQASRWHNFQRALDVIFNSCSYVTICMCCRELWGLSTLEWGKLLGAWWVDLPSRSWV